MAEKTYVFDSGSSSQIDPNLWAALNNGNGGFGGGFNSPFWALILLAFLRNGFGWNGDSNGATGFVSSQLGQAIAGNANAISNLATSLNCTEGQIQSAIAGVQNSIQQVANSNNMNAMQVVNSIQSGNTAIANQISQCCCDNKLLTTTQGYENRINNMQQSQLIQNGFSQVGYAAAEQTCAIKQSGVDNANRIIAKLDAMEDSRKDREINALTAQLTAATSRAERAAELAPVYQALNDIKAKQPSTVPVQWPQLTAIPTSQLYGYGLAGYGLNPGGSIWG